jgi:hypothetical protein
MDGCTKDRQKQKGVDMAAEPKRLPEGIKHLHGALYLIPFNMICLSEGDGEEKWNVTHNPRGMTQKGRDMINDPERASRMRNSIREKTLLAPMICRWLETDDEMIPQLVGGRCRHDALSFLIKKKESVKDPNTANFDEDTGEFTYEYRPANEVYGSDGDGIVCQIFSVTTDIEALSLAYAENACREQLTEGHDVATVIELREAGATNEEILKVLDYQEKWLKDTTKMIESLDKETLHAVIEGDIIREGAIGLSKIEDLDIRSQVRAAAKADAQEDHQKRMERLSKKYSTARDHQEIAEGELVEAEFNDAGEVSNATQNLDEANSAVERTKKLAEGAKPVVKNKNVRAGVQTVTGDDESGKRCLREPKIRKFYLDTLKALSENDGEDSDGEFAIDTDSLQMALDVVEGILSGERDLASILKSHALEYEDAEEGSEEGSEEGGGAGAVVAIREDEEEEYDADLDDVGPDADRTYPPGDGDDLD